MYSNAGLGQKWDKSTNSLHDGNSEQFVLKSKSGILISGYSKFFFYLEVTVDNPLLVTVLHRWRDLAETKKTLENSSFCITQKSTVNHQGRA